MSIRKGRLKPKRSRSKTKAEVATPMARVGGALFERLMMQDPDPRRRKFLAQFLMVFPMLKPDQLDQIDRIMEVVMGREELKKMQDPAGIA